MSKLFSISLSFIILIQSFGVSFDDLSQIDEFIKHAQYHSEQYGDTFFVFISKHYGDLKTDHNKQHQEEKEDHEQLPFQHHSHIYSTIAFVLNKPVEAFQELEFSEYKSHHFHYQSSSSSLHSEGLFHPPQLS